MRLIGLGICALAALGMAAAPPVKRTAARAAAAKPLPVFSFMGQDTETPTTMTALNGSPCTTSGTTTDCTDYKNPQVAGHSMQWMWMKYNRGRLYSVYAEMGEYAVADVRAAFVEKYGPPSSIETEKWQSKAGATFDNLVTTWKFKGGRLELRSLALQVDEGSFEFTSDANSPPPDKPKVDF